MWKERPLTKLSLMLWDLFPFIYGTRNHLHFLADETLEEVEKRLVSLGVKDTKTYIVDSSVPRGIMEIRFRVD